MMVIWCFTSLSTLFKSYQDNGRVNERLCARKHCGHELNSTSRGIQTWDLVIQTLETDHLDTQTLLLALGINYS